MDDDEGAATSDELDGDAREESWLAEQARLVLLEDGS
jgi:hypothetical protein